MGEIKNFATNVRSDTLEMITFAGSGHPGGALSSMDLFTLLWHCADIEAADAQNPDRDRVVVSHGHTSAGVYAVLGNCGYLDLTAAKETFRKDGSLFEGHPNPKIPGVEWCSGSLGQGLSIGAGFALAAKIKKQNYHTFVVMGDGEQAKGQIQEAREFAAKFSLGRLTAVIDCNHLQAGGKVEEIMPQHISEKYRAAGWVVKEVDGHDYQEMYQAFKYCYENSEKPSVILAKTIMGKGVSFIEDKAEYHGKALTAAELDAALIELQDTRDVGNRKNVKDAENARINLPSEKEKTNLPVESLVKYGAPICYSKDQKIDCRTAFGEALCDIASANSASEEVRIAALDCDLAESVKLLPFSKKFPEGFIECGIQEHNAASVAGALSKSGILTFFADFGVFGIDETYGQHRINDINNTSVKLICTHNGLDVGEDGKTHQCIDYISLMSNLYGFKILIPADANQTDRMIRFAATHPGNILIAMGRSKLPVLTTGKGDLMYGESYRVDYGKADWVRHGSQGTIIACGTMVYKAANISDRLSKEGIEIGVLNLSCPCELDIPAIATASKTGLIVTYEDHNVRTGIGSMIGAHLTENLLNCRFKRLGISRYGASAKPDFQYKAQGLDEESVIGVIKNELQK